MIMTKTSKLALASVVFLLAGVFSASEAWAGENTVIEIRVEGNDRLSDQAVLASVKTRCQQEFSKQIAQADEKRLLQTRRYSSVVVTTTQTEKRQRCNFK